MKEIIPACLYREKPKPKTLPLGPPHSSGYEFVISAKKPVAMWSKR